MSELVPDPTDERAPAVFKDDDGTVRLAPAVFVAPVGTPIEDMKRSRPVGYMTSGGL